MQPLPRLKYLTNKELLREIHLSKNSFSKFINSDYSTYDIIVPSVNGITEDHIKEAKISRAERIAKQNYEKALLSEQKVSMQSFVIDPETIPTSDIIFRIMTFDHIPLAPFRKKTIKIKSDMYERVNFPPFQHWKYNESGELICVGKSHWKGDIDTGHFSKTHGKITENLGRMFMKLCERYATRSNVRGYCVDTETEALTDKGWSNIDTITENDKILSYNNGTLVWSSIKSIYRGEYNGLMHHITSNYVDFFITPEHKLVTSRGLIKAEFVKQDDQIIILGNETESPLTETYTHAFVELVGWVITRGCYKLINENNDRNVVIFHATPENAIRIRNCLHALNFSFSESDTNKISINTSDSKTVIETLPEKSLSIDFILALTSPQRELLINVMVDGNKWQHSSLTSYCQRDKQDIDMFQALLTITGKKSNYTFLEYHPHANTNIVYDIYSIETFAKKENITQGNCLNFNGGLVANAKEDSILNVPTVPYNGKVWCPETEYGCFVARRNGKVYLTGNTYNDEMRSQAILQLVQMGLQFDESKSSNAFSYYTSATINAFVRIINLEKKHQNLRDDLLEKNGMNPSWTRTNTYGTAHEYDHD